MSENFKNDAKFEKNPQFEGVFMKHLFSSEDNDRLNNVEIRIIPGFEIGVHSHSDSTEFFYIVEGEAEFLEGDKWVKVAKGDAFKAPIDLNHAIKNTGYETLTIFSTFSPAIR